MAGASTLRRTPRLWPKPSRRAGGTEEEFIGNTPIPPTVPALGQVMEKLEGIFNKQKDGHPGAVLVSAKSSLPECDT